MGTQYDISLSELNTLGVPSIAPYYVSIFKDTDVPNAISWAQLNHLPVQVLGGGSNVILPNKASALVLHMQTKGIHAFEEENSVTLRVAAGENWDALVRHCLEKKWYGIENLISIPGSVGAAPIQNIGAYGVELSSVLQGATGYDMRLSAWRYMSADDMQLDYRDSVFKHAMKDRFVITQVMLKLSKQATPKLGYAALDTAIAAAMEATGQTQPTPELAAQVIAAMRAEKLPDPAKLPNAGSFFKNPLVTSDKHAELCDRFPNMPSWPYGDGYKLAAAWLIDNAGWKGFSRDGVGVHDRQALVLINPGHCSGAKIIALAAEIAADVYTKYQVELEIEPRIC